MIFSYEPLNGGARREWPFKPQRIMSPEAEAIERVTGLDFAGAFGHKLIGGSMLARRALLWILLKRDTPTLRFEDVSLCMEETGLRYENDELAALAAGRDDLPPEQAAAADAILAAAGYDPEQAPDPTQVAAAAS